MPRTPGIPPAMVMAAALCALTGLLTFAALAADEHKAAEHGAPAKAEAKPAAKADAKAEAKADPKSDPKSDPKAKAEAPARSAVASESKVDGKTLAAAGGKVSAPAEAAPPPPPKPVAKPVPRPPVQVSSSVAPELRRFTPVTEPGAARAAAGPAKAAASTHGAPAAAGTTTRSNGITMTVAPVVEDAHAHPPHWSYEGTNGPQAWAKLAPEFAACGNGQRQSPIDIRDGMKLDLDPIGFEYRPSAFKVIDNGHTIQAIVSGWNSIRIMGRVFRLEQFHFHRPSEEMIDGKQFEMVVHLVHKDSQGRLAVVAVLIEVGARQPVVQAVLNNLPLEQNQELRAGSNIDLSQLLPANRRYFTYMGSLTTPPCTEDVLWIVMKQPVQASAEQIDLFSRLYPMNARPIQEGMGRMIKESN